MQLSLAPWGQNRILNLVPPELFCLIAACILHTLALVYSVRVFNVALTGVPTDPVAVLPSVFFINTETGFPLQIVRGSISVSDFVSKICRVFEVTCCVSDIHCTCIRMSVNTLVLNICTHPACVRAHTHTRTHAHTHTHIHTHTHTHIHTHTYARTHARMHVII